MKVRMSKEITNLYPVFQEYMDNDSAKLLHYRVWKIFYDD